ncbi:hypothetical protein MHYP_G00018340 [Metynnis hypsauchen]
MSVVELEEELKALRERLVREKTEMDKLKNKNEELTAQLLGKGQTPSGKNKSPHSTCPPSPAASVAPSNVLTSVEVMYMPKDKKNVMFSGQPGTIPFHEWVDELQNSFNFRRYGQREQAALLYGHLEGEARQEIRHSPSEVRKNPNLILETLKEAYGQPYSLTITQKRFFDRKQKEGEGLREFSHALLALSEDVNRCNGGVELCSDQTIRNQFAENVRDSSLRRELKRLIRQDPEIKFSSLRREAILFWEEEFRDMLKKQDEKLEGLARKVEALQMQKGRRTGGSRQEPRTLPPAKKRRWVEHLPEVVFAYNTTEHASTGFTPYFLMFGQAPNLPIDLLLSANTEHFSGTRDDWVLEHQNRLQEAYQQARGQLQHAAALRRKYQGVPTPDSLLRIGQLVYRKNHGWQGRHKIQDVWMSVPFRVIAQPDPDKAVYTVVPIDGSLDPKNIHRTELRPCSQELEVEEVAERAQGDYQTDDGESSVEDEPRPLWVKREVWTKSDDRRQMGVGVVDGEGLDVGMLSPEENEGIPSRVLHGNIMDSNIGEACGQSEGAGDIVSPQEKLRRSSRQTAGKHTNPFNLQRSARDNELGIGACQDGHVSCVWLTVLKDLLSTLVTSLGKEV